MSLFSPSILAGITFPNRIAVSPMSQYRAVDGFANDWRIVHLGRFAMGGAGLVYLEATTVEERGRRTPGDLGIWDDAHIPELKRIVSFLEAGFKIIEVYAAHGFLIHQFYSPAANHRTDQYGGDFEGRSRFALEVADAI